MDKKAEIITGLKITAAAVAAYIIAETAGLEFSVSAGIVAILSVLPTKKETVRTALDRFVAFAVALIIAALCFSFLGFNLPAFCVYLLLFIVYCRIFGFYSAMAMDSVLISHFLSTGRMDLDTIINEVLLFFIGTLMGIIVNLTLRKDKKKTDKLTLKTDEQIRHILIRASERVIDTDMKDYDGKCLIKLDKLLEKARKQALTDYKNDLIDPDDSDIRYIEMRMKQSEILSEIYRNVSDIRTTPDTAKIISDFLVKTANEYDRENDVSGLLKECESINDDFKDRPLPKTRDEFEDRARLFVLMRSIEDFLKIKKEMYK
ncbi:MAG: hypothetical protein K6F79_04525 [Saccharofermentans sp.]|nr:hypothetical protein [Saccharofermentans sp.]